MNTTRCLPFGLLALLALAVAAQPAQAADPQPTDLRAAVDAVGTGKRAAVRRGGPPGKRLARGQWGFALEATYLRQLASDIAPGSRFAATRILTRLGVSYGITSTFPLSLSIGYRYDGYHFDGGGSAAFPGKPWGQIHSPRLTLPVFVPLGARWLIVGGLTVRSTVEEGAPLEDGVTGGAFFGAGYKVSDRLTVGPGFGLVSELEDDPSFFPVIFVNWKIRHDLTLKTGRGLGSTQGPGVFLEWTKSSRWSFSLGARYERLRFRLDGRGIAPGGIGEDKSFALVSFAQYQASRKLTFNASIGANFEGALRLEDRNGNRLFSEAYDSALLLGFGLSLDL